MGYRLPARQTYDTIIGAPLSGRRLLYVAMDGTETDDSGSGTDLLVADLLQTLASETPHKA